MYKIWMQKRIVWGERALCMLNSTTCRIRYVGTSSVNGLMPLFLSPFLIFQLLITTHVDMSWFLANFALSESF